MLLVEAPVRKAATMSLRLGRDQALGWAPAVEEESPGLELLGKVKLTSLNRIIFSDAASSLINPF